MINQMIQLLKEEEGQSMVEYGIILALISVVAIGVVQAIGQKITQAYSGVDQQLGNVAGNGGTATH